MSTNNVDLGLFVVAPNFHGNSSLLAPSFNGNSSLVGSGFHGNSASSFDGISILVGTGFHGNSSLTVALSYHGISGPVVLSIHGNYIQV